MSQTQEQEAAERAVRGLLKADKAKALAVAVLVAASSLSGCSVTPENAPCPGPAASEPCVQPSGEASGWLQPPRWPALEQAAGGGEGRHLASERDFPANPQYTQLRAGQSDTDGGPRYYGGTHSYYWHTSISEGGGGYSGTSS